MTGRQRLVAAICAIAGIAACAAVFHYVRYGWEMCHPARSRVTQVERDTTRDRLPGSEEISFQTRDGLTLRGWFVPSRNGVVVVFAHGLGGNRALFLREAEILARHGYGSLLFDARAHGDSDGTVATWGDREADDMRAAVSFAFARATVRSVALLGFSVGGSAVALAAADDLRIGAVILYATWPSLRDEIRYKFPRSHWLADVAWLSGFRLSGVDVDRIRPIDAVARIAPRPLLMIAGALDADTPPVEMDRLFSAAAEPKQIWREPGAEHGGYVRAAPAEYERRVVAFLDGALAH